MFGSSLEGPAAVGRPAELYADSADHGEKICSCPAPPAGVRRSLRATPSAAGPFLFLGLLFRGLSASILTFVDPILALREHLGKLF